MTTAQKTYTVKIVAYRWDGGIDCSFVVGSNIGVCRVKALAYLRHYLTSAMFANDYRHGVIGEEY